MKHSEGVAFSIPVQAVQDFINATETQRRCDLSSPEKSFLTHEKAIEFGSTTITCGMDWDAGYAIYTKEWAAIKKEGILPLHYTQFIEKITKHQWISLGQQLEIAAVKNQDGQQIIWRFFRNRHFFSDLNSTYQHSNQKDQDRFLQLFNQAVKTIEIQDQRTRKTFAAKAETEANYGLSRQLIHLGRRVDAVFYIDDHTAWMKISFRKFDNGSSQVSVLFKKIGNEWKSSLAKTVDLATIPVNWPPPRVTQEYFQERMRAMILLNYKGLIEQDEKESKK